ncbi:MAG: heme NO-binding domain-containing protein [Gammaproteobacteria bacterium]|nr:heme NO-binding domain-containing protein [Gammaproteobacteria bacterium]
MKGIVFTSFISFLENELGLIETESIIIKADLNSACAYTTVGSYDFKELLHLILLSSQSFKITPKHVSQRFGSYLFTTLTSSSPQYVKNKHSCFELFETINNVIHMEVKSIYPETTPPRVHFKRISSSAATLHYQSHRCLGDVMYGVIEGAGNYFNEKLLIERNRLNKKGSEEVFTVIILQ